MFISQEEKKSGRKSDTHHSISIPIKALLSDQLSDRSITHFDLCAGSFSVPHEDGSGRVWCWVGEWGVEPSLDGQFGTSEEAGAEEVEEAEEGA